MARTQQWSTDLPSMNIVLKALRDQSKDIPTQEALAEKTGFTQSKVAAVESGRPVQMDDLETWAQGLGVNPDVLKRFQRTLEGYLWSAEAGEFWWRDYISSEYEQKMFMTEPPTCLDEEQLEAYEQNQADDFYDYSRERYREYFLNVAKELFSHTNSQVSIKEIHSNTVFGNDCEMWIELAPTTQRPEVKIIRVNVEPPWETPSELLNWMIQNDAKKEIIAKQIGEVLTAKEFKKVVAYVQGLLDSRTAR